MNWANTVNLMPLFISAALIIGLTIWLARESKPPKKPPEKHDPATCDECRYS